MSIAPDHATGVRVPAGWPSQVASPGSVRMRRDAVAFLLEHCPPEFRAHVPLRRRPLVLARLAAAHVDNQLKVTRRALAQEREGPEQTAVLGILDDAAAVLRKEETRLIKASRSVALVEQALRAETPWDGHDADPHR